MTHQPTPPVSLTLYSTYTTTLIGVFHEEKLLESTSVTNKEASAYLPLQVNGLLNRQGIALSHLSFIGVYQGPGPFTSLRVTIAFAHGLLAATDVPLVGVNGFYAFAAGWFPQPHNHSQQLLVLLEAFCNEVYFGLFDHEKKLLTSGCCHRDHLKVHLDPYQTDQITIVGNAQDACKDDTFLKTDSVSARLEDVGNVALRNFIEHPAGEGFLLPLYLKHPAVHKSALCPSQP